MTRARASWSQFFSHIEKQKAKHPEIGAEYEAVYANIQALEKEAVEKFHYYSASPDFDGYYQFKRDRIVPLKKREAELWNLLMDKKVHNNTLAHAERN